MAIQIRRGTDSEWESNKSNIVAGEPAVAMDSERMFVGTGSGTYMELANIDVLADPFDSSASYVVGDFTAYHGKLYKCNTDHSGAWNASHFDEVSLADALDALDDDVYTKAEADALLVLKADKSDTYTKEEVEELVQQAEYTNFEMKSVSGDFIHITDGAGLIPVKDLKIGIDAVQDLHGYDAPWVGGAGINKMPAKFYSGLGYNNAVGTQITLTELNDVTQNGNTFRRTVGGWGGMAMVSEPLELGTYRLMVKLKSTNIRASRYVLNSDLTISRNLGNDGSGTSTDIDIDVTLTDNEAYIAFGIYSSTDGTVSAEIPQVAAGSGAKDYAPYANICPISGWTGAIITVQQGVNQWDEKWEVGIIGSNGKPDSYDTTHIRSKNFIAVMPSTTYRLRGARANIFEYDFNKNFLNDLGGFIGTDSGSATFTTGSNTRFLKFYCTTNYGATYKHDISINYPSTETGYHAFDGHVYSVTWEEAGTVYGGTLDVTTGELVVTDASVTFDGSDDETWVKFGSGSASAFAMATPFDHAFVVSNDNLIANYLKSIPTTATWGNENGWISSQNNGAIMTGIKSITEVADWRTYLSNNPLQVVYELITPQTYQLAPTEVLTLLGENNIFADTGAVEELIYRISNQ